MVRTSSILLSAIVLTAFAAHAQRTASSAPLDELDDASWLRSYAEASGSPLREILADSELEASIWVLAALPADDAPEKHLLALAALASGDDPDLAPAAAQTAMRIAEELSFYGLSSRESTIDAEATDAFRALAEDPTARADLQLAAAYIVARLGELERDEVP